VAFRSGAALAHLALETVPGVVPLALFRDRLALVTAGVCAGFAGRHEAAAGLRDAVHLTRLGDNPGPSGAIFGQCSRAVTRPITVAHLGKALDGVAAERIALCLNAAGGTPVDRAAQVLKSMLADSPRAETAALILADAVLSKALSRDHVLPLISLALTPRNMRLWADDLRLACQQAVMAGGVWRFRWQPIWRARRCGSVRWFRSCGPEGRFGRSSCSCRAMRWRLRRWT